MKLELEFNLGREMERHTWQAPLLGSLLGTKQPEEGKEWVANKTQWGGSRRRINYEDRQSFRKADEGKREKEVGECQKTRGDRTKHSFSRCTILFHLIFLGF